MSKTKLLVIACTEARVVPNGRNMVTVHIDEPHVGDALTSFSSEDIVSYVASEYGPDEVFEEKDLQKWAEENGYIKE